MPVERSHLEFYPISDIELLRSPFLPNGYSGIVSHHESSLDHHLLSGITTASQTCPILCREQLS
jgi:hypothetical protein